MGQTLRCDVTTPGFLAENATESEKEITDRGGKHAQQEHRYRIVSVNVGRLQETEYRGRIIKTGIFKKPVTGPVRIGYLNLEGDEQADLRFHGGEDKAVYIYPVSHYQLWEDELGREIPYGQFGENLTVDGLHEGSVRVGDVYRAGTALLQVTQPRFPCFKLGIRMGDQRFVKRFLVNGRTGFYTRVLREGQVATGDTLGLVFSDPGEPTISQVVGALTLEG